jgi:hypothetical protein
VIGSASDFSGRELRFHGGGGGGGGDGGGGGAVPSESGARWQQGCCHRTGRWIIADGGGGVHRSRLGFGGVTP